MGDDVKKITKNERDFCGVYAHKAELEFTGLQIHWYNVKLEISS